MPKSMKCTSVHSTVLMIVRPPGLPVTSTRRPSRMTNVGVCALSMRLPGAMRLGAVPMSPSRVVRPGTRLKSVISLLRRKPAPRTTTLDPKACSRV